MVFWQVFLCFYEQTVLEINRYTEQCMRCDYARIRVHYSLLKGATFEGHPLSSYALSSMMLPLLETFLELLLWNNFQCHHHIFWMSSVS
jgi:hypothetical protein